MTGGDACIVRVEDFGLVAVVLSDFLREPRRGDLGMVRGFRLVKFKVNVEEPFVLERVLGLLPSVIFSVDDNICFFGIVIFCVTYRRSPNLGEIGTVVGLFSINGIGTFCGSTFASWHTSTLLDAVSQGECCRVSGGVSPALVSASSFFAFILRCSCILSFIARESLVLVMLIILFCAAPLRRSTRALDCAFRFFLALLRSIG